MKPFLKKWKKLTAFWLALLLTFSAVHFAGIGISTVEANNTPQALPFSQDWSNVGLITANDDWSMVPGIVGFLGDYTTASPTNVDPRTLVADFATNGIDVIANQATPNTQTAGGVAEFDGIPNPTIALQGSGTADAPHIVIYLNTTGRNNIRVAFNARDIDGSADNAVQPIAVQYRVGATGDFITVPGGYIADATTGPNEATLVTPVAVTLPVAANNQPNVQVRIITTNAAGSDEWVGIDDISVTAVAVSAPNRANVDFNGDGRSDYAVTRTSGSNKIWYIANNGDGAVSGVQFGIGSDIEVPEDYDGDGKDDVAVWRPGAFAHFYVLRSSNNTFTFNQFGQTGDDPRVVADYDGDGRADYAVYRASAGQGFFYYRSSISNAQVSQPFGSGTTTRPNVGDYDGDGKADFCVHFNNGGNGFFALQKSTGGNEFVGFGFPSDALAPGDYDGDGRSDFTVVRREGGLLNWFTLTRTGAISGITWGASTDVITPGDYDGDGRSEPAIWRPTTDTSPSVFYSRRSDGLTQSFAFGTATDYPVANWYVHPGFPTF